MSDQMRTYLIVVLIIFVFGVLPILAVILSIRKAMKAKGMKTEMRPVEYLLILLYFTWFVFGLLIFDRRRGEYLPLILYWSNWAVTVLTMVYYMRSMLAPSKEDGDVDADLNYVNAPGGVLTTMGDKVYLCLDFKRGRAFSAHPRKVFTILMIFFCMNLFNMAALPVRLMDAYLILFLLGAVGYSIWFARMMEKFNWNLQSAFILRDGKLYFMRLGYVVTGGGMAGAEENLSKESDVRDKRRNPETYSKYLNMLTGEYESCAGVVRFIKLTDPKIESKDRMFAEISYGQPGDDDRQILKVRNGYDWSMMDHVRG